MFSRAVSRDPEKEWAAFEFGGIFLEAEKEGPGNFTLPIICPVAQGIEQWIPKPIQIKMKSPRFQLVIYNRWLFLCSTFWEMLGYFR